MAKSKRQKRSPLGPVLGFLISFVSVLTFLWMNQASAAPAPAAPAAKGEGQAAPKGAKKTTEVSFEDVLVQGKYHFSDEAVTTVEEDKVLDSLLGVRKDFQDRIKQSVSRQ
ncbi:MAG: hypothetical protein KF767_12455 [Bdellovibrionaceae bacterium]|nr:hypothetical protein [Pseudobdellovibrionaceae bacterium]